MLPFEAFAIEHGFEEGSTIHAYVVDSTNSVFMNDKMYSLEDGPEEREMSKMSLSDAGVRKLVGQQYVKDSITRTKDMEGSIHSVDVMTDLMESLPNSIWFRLITILWL